MTETSKQIRVLLAEDDKYWHGVVEKVINEIGATLTITTSFEKAAELLISGVFDIAILDGNLKRKKGRKDGEHNQDARELIQLIKDRKLKTRTVGFGGTAIVEADQDVSKAHYDLLAVAVMTLLIEEGAKRIAAMDEKPAWLDDLREIFDLNNKV